MHHAWPCAFAVCLHRSVMVLLWLYTGWPGFSPAPLHQHSVTPLPCSLNLKQCSQAGTLWLNNPAAAIGGFATSTLAAQVLYSWQRTVTRSREWP